MKTKIEEAVEKSIEGGWNPRPENVHIEIIGFHPTEYDSPFFIFQTEFIERGKENGRTFVLFLDQITSNPFFWRALGESLGWENKRVTFVVKEKTVRRVVRGGVEEYVSPEHTRSRLYKSRNWKYHWHLYIDHLADGKESEEFFKLLINQYKKDDQ